MEESTKAFYLEENRLKTFTNWIFSDEEICNVKRMAEAGFIFTGNKRDRDSAKCFLCSKNLDGWEKDDDPWKEHKSHSPKCAFVKIGKPELDITINEMIDIITLYYTQQVTDKYRKEIETCEELVEDMEAFMLESIEKEKEAS